MSLNILSNAKTDTYATRDAWLLLLKQKLEDGEIEETPEVVAYRNTLNNIDTSLERDSIAWPMTPFTHP